jgi:hypothetical protein
LRSPIDNCVYVAFLDIERNTMIHNSALDLRRLLSKTSVRYALRDLRPLAIEAGINWPAS